MNQSITDFLQLKKTLIILQTEYDELAKEHQITLNILKDEQELSKNLSEEIKSLKHYKKSFQELNNRLLEENLRLKSDLEREISHSEQVKTLKITRLKQKKYQYTRILQKEIDIIDNYSEFIQKIVDERLRIEDLSKIINEKKYEKDGNDVLIEKIEEKGEALIAKAKFHGSQMQENFVKLAQIAIYGLIYKQIEDRNKDLQFLSKSLLQKTNKIDILGDHLFNGSFEEQDTIGGLLDELTHTQENKKSKTTIGINKV